MYKVGDWCKHFKGKNLIEKNIYEILELNVKGTDLNKEIKYTGEKEDYSQVTDLVIYKNLFQENKVFAREESDIKTELSKENQKMYNQKYRVEVLTNEEIALVSTDNFKEEKTFYMSIKFK